MRVLKKAIWPTTAVLTDNTKESDDIIKDWCNLNIGKSCWIRYISGTQQVYAFRDEQSLLLFKLRWSTKSVKKYN